MNNYWTCIGGEMVGDHWLGVWDRDCGRIKQQFTTDGITCFAALHKKSDIAGVFSELRQAKDFIEAIEADFVP